ncbi:DUF4041 domain-containing protein [Micromonospora sp. CA-259024]|uniref:DUF4041 domain-containing protein n=1 Tax=Micromonospora sp. CA-259024 TaxID=3239965 RepID=UPI003D8FDE8B
MLELRELVVVTEETALLQKAGVYEYRHPLSDAVAYQAALAQLQGRIKGMTKRGGGAVLAATGWTVNGSVAEGRVMLRDFSKLMLRAYNAEADNLVRGLKPYRLDSAVERLGKAAATIAKLGKTMHIRISEDYHQLRVRELELTADYQTKVAQERSVSGRRRRDCGRSDGSSRKSNASALVWTRSATTTPTYSPHCRSRATSTVPPRCRSGWRRSTPRSRMWTTGPPMLRAGYGYVISNWTRLARRW